MAEDHQAYQNDEISLKEAILTFQSYWKEIKKSLLLIALFIIPLLAYKLYKVYSTDPLFPAELSFMLNENSGNSMGAISGLLGQFGINQGSEENLDKILELSKSQKIANSVFFKKKKVSDKNDYLANHIIDLLENYGEWYNTPMFGANEMDLTGFRFTNDSIPAFEILDRKALKHLHSHLIGNEKLGIDALLKTRYQDASGIMNIDCISKNAEVSIHIVKTLYDELSKYYVEKTIEKQQFTFNILDEKTDSIATLLKSKEYELANFKDRNQGLFARTDQLTEQRLMREVQKLGIMYGEATKNLEIADFTLKDKTPFIQIIDEPFLPIKPNKPKLISSIINALILGIFFGVLFVVMRKMIRDALA